MFAYPSRRAEPARAPATRLRRITAVLAALTGGLLAWAAVVPAASAAIIPVPDPGRGHTGPPRHPVRQPGLGDHRRRHARLADHADRWPPP